MDISKYVRKIEERLREAKKHYLLRKYVRCCSTCYQVAEEALKAALKYPGCPIVGHSLMALLKELTRLMEVPRDVESSCQPLVNIMSFRNIQMLFVKM